MFNQSFYYCNNKKSVYFLEDETMKYAPVCNGAILYEKTEKVLIGDKVNNNNFFEFLRLILKT